MAYTTTPFAERYSREWLEEQYVERGRTTTQIGEMTGVAASTVAYTLRKLGILRRQVPDVTATELRRMYYEQNMTLREMATELRCGIDALRSLMARHAIPIKPKTESGKRAAQAQAIWNDPAWLAERRRAGVSQAAMAQEAGCTQKTIAKALGRHAVDPEVECSDACPYFGDCLDWPAERPCPVVIARCSHGENLLSESIVPRE
jgi:DNA-binding XRE family transcriptional regulator